MNVYSAATRPWISIRPGKCGTLEKNWSIDGRSGKSFKQGEKKFLSDLQPFPDCLLDLRHEGLDVPVGTHKRSLKYFSQRNARSTEITTDI